MSSRFVFPQRHDGFDTLLRESRGKSLEIQYDGLQYQMIFCQYSLSNRFLKAFLSKHQIFHHQELQEINMLIIFKEKNK